MSEQSGAGRPCVSLNAGDRARQWKFVRIACGATRKPVQVTPPPMKSFATDARSSPRKPVPRPRHVLPARHHALGDHPLGHSPDDLRDRERHPVEGKRARHLDPKGVGREDLRIPARTPGQLRRGVAGERGPVGRADGHGDVGPGRDDDRPEAQPQVGGVRLLEPSLPEHAVATVLERARHQRRRKNSHLRVVVDLGQSGSGRRREDCDQAGEDQFAPPHRIAQV